MFIYSRVRPTTYTNPMHTTGFPLRYKGNVYDQYFTYGSPHTLQYLKCLLFGHKGISHTSISVSAERGIETTVPANCCDRSYYSSKAGK